jgi:ABC-type Fe3+ transport system permease subunit
MNQDEEHLRLLSIFHYVCAGMAAFFACIPIIHVIVGSVMLLHPQPFVSQNNQPHPEKFVGLLFVVIGGMFILLGWAFAACLAYAGRCLGQRKHYTYCMVVAALACMFMPFGTVLGVFTLMVLIRPSVKPLFNGMTPPAVAT